jgi:CRP-like cAMP-binding protein
MPRYVHFITSGMASIVTEMSQGDGVEVGIAGREDLPQSLHLLGPATGQSRCFMQVEGTGLRMDFRQFQHEFQTSDTVRRLVLRHVQYEALMTAQMAACNRLHSVDERLARWLLMVAVRIGSDELRLTQEFLGNMLGARRATVTLAAGALMRSGLIDYRRGYIRLLNREALEDTACECFAVTQRLLQGIYL